MPAVEKSLFVYHQRICIVALKALIDSSPALDCTCTSLEHCLLLIIYVSIQRKEGKISCSLGVLRVYVGIANEYLSRGRHALPRERGECDF